VFYNQSEWWRAGNGYCLKYMGDKCHVVVKSDRCYATYHGDVAPALMVLDADLEIAGASGTRRGDAFFAALDKAVRKEIQPMESTLTAAGYRRRVAGGLAKRLVERLYEAAR
jgi:CO/xanthine dehydrogenase FAD-binding subunit